MNVFRSLRLSGSSSFTWLRVGRQEKERQKEHYAQIKITLLGEHTMDQWLHINYLNLSLYQVHEVYINTIIYWPSYVFSTCSKSYSARKDRESALETKPTRHPKLLYLSLHCIFKADCVKVIYRSQTSPKPTNLTFISVCTWSSLWKSGSILTIIKYILLMDVYLCSKYDRWLWQSKKKMKLQQNELFILP